MTELERTIINRTFEIPEGNLGLFHQKIALYQKLAKKLNLEPLNVVEVGEPVLKPVTVITVGDGVFDRKSSLLQKVHTYDVSGYAPKIEGWSFIGSLDHIEGMVKPVINSFADERIPDKYWSDDCEPDCDHCHLKRKRSKTVIIRNNDSGEYKQIGSTCLSDFFPYGNPETIISAMQLITVTLKDIGGIATNEVFYAFDDPMQLISLHDVLAKANHDISLHGFVSAKQAEENCSISTGQMVASQYTDKPYYLIKTNADDELVATEVIDWLLLDQVKALADKHNYYANLLTFAQSGAVNLKHVSTAASAVVAFQRAQLEAKNQAMPGNYVGIPGEKLVDYPVNLVRSIAIEDYTYNKVKHLLIFQDEQNNTLAWMCSGAKPAIPLGESIHLSGTITEHKIYKDRPQTQLTRCTVLEDKLLQSIVANDEKGFLKLLKRKPNVNVMVVDNHSGDTQSYSLLYKACEYSPSVDEKSAIIDVLIDSVDDVRMGSKQDGITPASVFWATTKEYYAGSAAILKALLERDPDILSVSKTKSGTPLLEIINKDLLDLTGYLDESTSPEASMQ